MNGCDVVKKWRLGGFYLVFMDIMFLVMNGLEVICEIWRLECVNLIGVFLLFFGGVFDGLKGELVEQDCLENLFLFKSFVIVVVLIVSLLQSDRYEVLVVGCNDFLIKVWYFGQINDL